MANQKISELTELAQAPASGDEVEIRDVSAASASQNKRITIQNLSRYFTAVVTIQLFDDGTDVSVGDGAGDTLWRVPSTLNGFDLIGAVAYVQTAGTTNATTVQIHNVTQAVDMLSLALSIASGAVESGAASIDTDNDDVATGDKIRIDVDAVSTTAPKGLWVELQFRLP